MSDFDKEQKKDDSWDSPSGLDPMTVMRMASAYWQSSVLHTANRLDVFNRLDGKSKDLETLAKESESDVRCLGTLLTACVSMGYLDRDGDVFSNSLLSQTFLVNSSKFYQGGIVYMFENWYEAWGKLYTTVKEGKPAVQMHHDYSVEENKNYMMGMHNRALSQSGVLMDMVDLSGKKQLMDVGCGPGTFSVMFCKKHPQLKAIIMDLEQTLVVAKEIIDMYQIADRVIPRVGNYNDEELGSGNDAMLLSSMTNQESPENIKQLLAKCYNSMVSGGIIMIQEQLLHADKKGPQLAALIGVNQIVNTAGGTSYSTTEMETVLSNIGFTNILSRQMSPPSPFILLTAEKP